MLLSSWTLQKVKTRAMNTRMPNCDDVEEAQKSSYVRWIFWTAQTVMT